MGPQETGSVWEREVVAFLRDCGLPAVRLRGEEGPRDHGDVGGFSRFAIDCKDQARLSLGPWIAQAKQEARNSNKPLAVVIARRRGHPVKDAYVVLDLATFARLESYLQLLREEGES